MTHRCRRAGLVMVLAINASGCGLILAPICLARQHRDPVATLTGDVAPGAVVVHRVKYGIKGSQNDLVLSWTGQRDATGPNLRAYITRVECEHFDPMRVSGPRGGVCASIGSIGSTWSANARPCVRDNTCKPLPADLVQTRLGITHGRGNPEQLGSNPEYKLWIFGDTRQTASYTIDITSFYGPDC